jgi:peptidoglycan L-alanyl-D-glutamate endopeptidase CwlK
MKLSATSLARLKGVHPDLVRVVKRAADLYSGVFVVTEGLRTLARQKQLVAAGASQTLNSRHLTGHAIDVAPVIGGKVSWDWPPFFQIAEAMRQAARAEGVQIRWGGCWDRRLNVMNGSPERESAAYVQRRRAQKRKAFLDGPHFELPSELYPK